MRGGSYLFYLALPKYKAVSFSLSLPDEPVVLDRKVIHQMQPETELFLFGPDLFQNVEICWTILLTLTEGIMFLSSCRGSIHEKEFALGEIWIKNVELFLCSSFSALTYCFGLYCVSLSLSAFLRSTGLFWDAWKTAWMRSAIILYTRTQYIFIYT